MSLAYFFNCCPSRRNNSLNLTLHRDHLLAHVKSDLGSLQVHPHLLDEEMRHPNTLDLIGGINF